MSRKMSRTSARSGTLGQAHTWTGIKIKNETIRILRMSVGTESPLRNVNLQGRQLG